MISDVGKLQQILHKVTLPYVEHNECQDLLQAVPELSAKFKLDESFICAGGDGLADTCEGDGGGALFCPLKADPNRMVQVGIVATGFGCGKPNVPGMYASVMHGLCFIKTDTFCKVRNWL